MNNLYSMLNNQLINVQELLIAINLLISLIFAGTVARDGLSIIPPSLDLSTNE